MFKKYKMREQWQGTPTGEAMLEIQRLHETLVSQPAKEQEVTRQRIEELVRGLRQTGVFGKYDIHLGQFVEEPAGKQRRKKG